MWSPLEPPLSLMWEEELNQIADVPPAVLEKPKSMVELKDWLDGGPAPATHSSFRSRLLQISLSRSRQSKWSPWAGKP